VKGQPLIQNIIRFCIGPKSHNHQYQICPVQELNKHDLKQKWAQWSHFYRISQ